MQFSVVIPLVTGPNSTQLCLVQSISATHGITAKLHTHGHAINYTDHKIKWDIKQQEETFLLP